MDTGNTSTWLRKREVASLMQVDLQTVQHYWEQGRLPGIRLFGGRIILFRRSDVDALMETLRTQEHPEQEHANNGT